MGDESFEVDDIDALDTGGARFATSADRLQNSLKGPIAAIRALNATAPWGNDEAGRSFQRGYPVDTVHKQLDVTRSRAADLVEMGADVRAATERYRDSDHHAKITIERTEVREVTPRPDSRS